MKKLVTFTTMAFLLATAGAFAQAPPTTPATGDKPAAKTSKSAKAHKGHKKPGKTTTTTPDATPAQK